MKMKHKARDNNNSSSSKYVYFSSNPSSYYVNVAGQCLRYDLQKEILYMEDNRTYEIDTNCYQSTLKSFHEWND